VLARALDLVANEHPVEQLADLHGVLDRVARCITCAGAARTLDLLGHSTGRRLLQLGSTEIDPAHPDVRREFERLAREGVLARLNIDELRLLGCQTAMSPAGQETIRRLTQLLGIRVVGTTKLVYAAYFGDTGLKGRYEDILCDASSLPDLAPAGATPIDWPVDPAPPPAPRFDLDEIEAVPADQLPATDCPRILAENGSAPGRAAALDSLPGLIERDDGRLMPKMLVRPTREVLIGTGEGSVRRVEVLFDHQLVRVRQGPERRSAVYRVSRPGDLEAWLDQIEQ
jgi:hypothetical protein